MEVLVKIPLVLLAVFFWFFSILVTGCGEGSLSNPIDNDDSPISGNLNPELSGRLFFSNGSKGTIVSEGSQFSAWTMDIANGNYVKISNTNWGEQNNRFPGNWTTVFTNPVDDYVSNEFIVEIPDCKNDPDMTCISIQDMNGDYLVQFEIFGDEYSFSRLSPDLQNIVLVNRIGAESWLEIYNRNGELLLSSKLESRFIRQISWLGIESIIYSIGRTFYFTEPETLQIENTLVLPDSVVGDKINNFSVSPDRARLVFLVDGVPYIANINGSQIRKLAKLSSAEVDANNIVWSPDGSWILLETNSVRMAAGPGGMIRSHNFILPSEDLGKAFVLSDQDALRSSEVRILRRYKSVEEIRISEITTDVGLNDVTWLP